MQYGADGTDGPERRGLYDASVQEASLDALDEAELNDLCSRMIRARSENPPGEEARVASIVAEWCEDLGGKVTVTEPVRGRPNVVARFSGTGDASSLAFSGHMDVVPVQDSEEERWTQKPYSGEVLDGELWGRGSVDMKGGLAAAMAAISAIRRTEVELPGDLWLLASMDEELEMTGVKAMIRNREIDAVDAAVVCEPTSLGLNCSSKGRTWATLRVLGEPAHAGFKDGGVNAITNAVRLATKLEESAPGHLTQNKADGSWWTITEIEGGLGPAIVPDRCDMTLDARLVAGQTCDMVWDEVQQMIEQLASEQPDFRCEIHVVERREPWEIASDSHVADALRKGLTGAKNRETKLAEFPGTTDASFLVPAGIPCVICGPGELSRAHREDERIPFTALADAARSYVLAALEFYRLTDTNVPNP